MQASINRYWLQHINLLREQKRAKGGLMKCSRVYGTKKSNSCSTGVYTKNQTVHLNPRDALFQYNKIQLMDCQFRISDVSFDNTISARSILSPKKNW